MKLLCIHLGCDGVERKEAKYKGHRELLRLETVSVLFKRSKLLRCFGYVECNDDAELVKRCVITEIRGTGQRRLA